MHAFMSDSANAGCNVASIMMAIIIKIINFIYVVLLLLVVNGCNDLPESYLPLPPLIDPE